MSEALSILSPSLSPSSNVSSPVGLLSYHARPVRPVRCLFPKCSTTYLVAAGNKQLGFFFWLEVEIDLETILR